MAVADLFSRDPTPPLAEAMRPKVLDEVIGQSDLLGDGKPLKLAFLSGKPHSMILWGPPGVGKTTLSEEMAKRLDATVVHLDDVYPGWGGLVDGRNRVIEDVIRPLRNGDSGSVVTWDWGHNTPGERLIVPPTPFVIVEGSGVSTPESRLLADTVMWVDASKDVRSARIEKRDGPALRHLFAAWERDVMTHIVENNPITTATVVVLR
jgi:hypothetical protein